MDRREQLFNELKNIENWKIKYSLLSHKTGIPISTIYDWVNNGDFYQKLKEFIFIKKENEGEVKMPEQNNDELILNVAEGINLKLDKGNADEVRELVKVAIGDWLVSKLHKKTKPVETPKAKILSPTEDLVKKPGSKRGFKAWRASEEKKLISYVKKHGANNQSYLEIGILLKRTVDACRLRYNIIQRRNSIIRRPGRKKREDTTSGYKIRVDGRKYKPWTKTEIEVMKKEINMRGESRDTIKKIAKLLNRSISSINNKWIITKEKRLKKYTKGKIEKTEKRFKGGHSVRVEEL